MGKSFAILRFFILALVFSLALSATGQDTTIISELKKLESQLPGILENNNVEALDKILHPEFTVQSSEGHLMRKNKLLESFRNGGNPYLKFRPQMDSVVIVNENMAITSGKEIFAHKAGLKHGEVEVRFFYHVWVKYNSNWLLAGRIIAPIPRKQDKIPLQR